MASGEEIIHFHEMDLDDRLLKVATRMLNLLIYSLILSLFFLTGNCQVRMVKTDSDTGREMLNVVINIP